MCQLTGGEEAWQSKRVREEAKGGAEPPKPGLGVFERRPEHTSMICMEESSQQHRAPAQNQSLNITEIKPEGSQEQAMDG